MKRCPTCQSTYADDSLSFCLTDGATLVDTAFNQQATLPYSSPRVSNDPQMAAPEVNMSPQGDWNRPAWALTPHAVAAVRPRNSTPWVIGGIAVLVLSAIIGIWLAIASRKSSGEAAAPVNRSVNDSNNQAVVDNSNKSPQNGNRNGNANQASTDTEAPPTDAELVLSQLTALEHEWNEANIKGNKATVRRIVANEFRGVGANGSVENKEQMLANLQPNPNIASLKLSDLKVSLAGNTAVLTGLNTAKAKNGRSITFRFTDTFVWRNGHWQAISSQATQVK